ncbi:MAG: hypothetical protein K0R77_307 [Chryseobacterium sp.]|jgi:hypothetical protein|uniref:hypothetical protein n=1 Tax=Chryseobacterium sp. TaxID=1871047 RepID=UPI002636D789|nr:hypothetical protein [Chryseobacterium sp.]MDF2551032.1 hypothetical protein [Chryseobacterium sp.]
MCRNDELISKDLSAKISKAGTVRSISGPATYHSQGSFMISNINIIYLINSKFFQNFTLTNEIAFGNISLAIALKPLSTSVKFL